MSDWLSWPLHIAGLLIDGAYRILTGVPQVEAAERALTAAEAALADIESQLAAANFAQRLWKNLANRRKAAQSHVADRRKKLQTLQQHKQQLEALPWIRVIAELGRTHQRFQALAAPAAPQQEPQHAAPSSSCQQQQQEQVPEDSAPSAPSIDEMWRVPGISNSQQAAHSYQSSWLQHIANCHQSPYEAHSPGSQPDPQKQHGSRSGMARDHESCCICLDGELDCGLIPCGHRVCRACGPALVTQPCPLCRSLVTATLVLY